MKNFLFTILLTICVTCSYAQGGNEDRMTVKEMLQAMKEMDAEFNTDDNGNVTLMQIVDVPNMTKDEIYQRALDYLTYNYMSGKDVVQTKDKEAGIVVGKGIYPNVHRGTSILTTDFNTHHILRVDCKDGRYRAIITLISYETTTTGTVSDIGKDVDIIFIKDQYPINPKGRNKTIMTKALYKSQLRAMTTFERLEKTIRDGATSGDIENSDW